MKKRCEICGKLYEVNNLHPTSHVEWGFAENIEDDVKYTNGYYHTCSDCAKKTGKFIDKLINGEV